MNLSSVEQQALYTEAVMTNLETACAVHRRADFFCWVQGALQGLLPHAGLICGAGAPLHFEWMGGFPVSRDLESRLCASGTGLASALERTWRRDAQTPLLLWPGQSTEPATASARLLEEIERLELSNCIAHGTLGPDGATAAFFAFFGVAGHTEDAQRAIRYFLPQLQVAWMRAIARASEAHLSAEDVAALLTRREVQVLRLLQQGRTNREIGELLGCHPKTVNSHMRGLFRKLHVHNRVQAVIKAMSGLLPDETRGSFASVADKIGS